MAEETVKKTTTRGKKKTTTQEVKETATTATLDDTANALALMQKQIEELQKQLLESQKKVDKADEEKSVLEKLVESLQDSKQDGAEKALPKKVKVMSLTPNKYNLTTEADGQGKQFTFEKIGDVITMRTSELEEILSIRKFREQAESGYFYILDEAIVEDQDLTEAYETIADKEALLKVMSLENDESVDVFCNLPTNLRESVATKMAEDILDGKRIDRNRIADISRRVDIDIEKIAETLKKSRK